MMKRRCFTSRCPDFHEVMMSANRLLANEIFVSQYDPLRFFQFQQPHPQYVPSSIYVFHLPYGKLVQTMLMALTDSQSNILTSMYMMKFTNVVYEVV